MRWLVSSLPWFLPGLAVSALVALAVAPFLARALGTHRAVAFLYVVSVGAIAAATIPPTGGGLDWTAQGVGRCDLDGPWLAPLGRYVRPTEESLNVLLFVPLGIAMALLPRSRRAMALAAATFALPVVVESTQLLVPLLGRGCEMGDVVNNTLGLIIGIGVGTVARTVAGGARALSAGTEPR